MSIAIFNQGSGVKDLVIKVVGGTVQPTGKVGLIWVNTATAINKWTFAAAEPSSPVTGDVWFVTGSASANTINILKRNAAIENILRAKQYNGTNWDVYVAYYHDGTSWTQVSVMFDPATDITFTGDSTFTDEGTENWKLAMITSGNLTFTNAPYTTIDVFLVGGGGGAANGAGGGGYTKTVKGIVPAVGTSYAVVVGAGGAKGSVDANAGAGGTSSALSQSVAGGEGGYGWNNAGGVGGAGGSGGGGYGAGETAGAGGTNGANGAAARSGSGVKGGAGQGTTTGEFGVSTATIYSPGGTAISNNNTGTAVAANIGAGGNGSHTAGGSGIVIIRNKR